MSTYTFYHGGQEFDILRYLGQIDEDAFRYFDVIEDMEVVVYLSPDDLLEVGYILSEDRLAEASGV